MLGVEGPEVFAAAGHAQPERQVVEREAVARVTTGRADHPPSLGRVAGRRQRGAAVAARATDENCGREIAPALALILEPPLHAAPFRRAIVPSAPAACQSAPGLMYNAAHAPGRRSGVRQGPRARKEHGG